MFVDTAEHGSFKVAPSERYETETGEPYFYNAASGETVWEIPAVATSAPPPQQAIADAFLTRSMPLDSV